MTRITADASPKSPSISLFAGLAALAPLVCGTVALIAIYANWLGGIIAPYILLAFATVLTFFLYMWRKDDRHRKLIKGCFDLTLTGWGALALAITFENAHRAPEAKIEITAILSDPMISAGLFGLLMGATAGRLAIASVDIFEAAFKKPAPLAATDVN